MSIEEENKAFIRHVYETINRRELTPDFQPFSPDYIEHQTTGDISLEEGRKFIDAFPDAKSTIEQIIAEGDKVAISVNWKATHQGEYMGIAPTGNKIDITNTCIIRIADGKWAETWVTTDELRLRQQLGIIPKQ